jgi:integrase
MSKRKSLVYQFMEKLRSMDRSGESRHEAKEKQKAATESGSVSGWQPIIVDGIFSHETMKSYAKSCAEFAIWARENFAARDFEATKAHASSYLQYRLDKGDSAWTLKLVRSALRKVYEDRNLTNDINLPTRKKAEITRSRGEKPMDQKFSVERNRNLVDFCRATGLRRHELKSLRVKDVRENEGRLLVDVQRGKGGRSRSVTVLKDLESRVTEIISGRNPDSKVIETIPVRADIHSYRRDYASAYYKELAGKDFDSKDKDTSAMLQVSSALGHNRLDVVTRNYLD